MYLSWKTASALFVLALAGTAGCAAGDEEAASDGATLEAAAADHGPQTTTPPDTRGEVNVTVNVDEIGSNDSKGGHSCGHGHGHHGHHGHHGGQDGSPPASSPPPPPAPPSAEAQPNPT